MSRARHPFISAAAVIVVTATCLGQSPPAPQAPQGEPPPAAAPIAPAGLASPAATLRTFLEAMSRADLDAAAGTLDLSEAGREGGRDLAVKLLGALNRIEEVDFDEHPDSEDLAPGGANAGATEWRVYPRGKAAHWRLVMRTGDNEIALSRGEDGRWRFSAETVAAIPELYDDLRDLEVLTGLEDERTLSFALRLESRLPRSLVENEFLGLRYWQWIGLLILILAGVVLDFTVRLIGALIARRVIAHRGGEARAGTIRRMVRPYGLAAAAALWLSTVHLLGLPGQVLTVVLVAVRLFSMLALVWAGFRTTDLVGEVAAGRAARTESKFDDVLIPLLKRTVKIFIFIIGLIYIADSFQIEIAPLLAGLGIGGIGFAFAARDTLENFFGSVTVIADRPFQVGDWVVIGDTEGTVEDLGFRSTRIRTFYNSLITIPNGNLVRAVVDNYGRRKYRRFKTHVAITYDTPPEAVDAFCEGIRELIRLHPYTRKDYYQVWLHEFGDSSLEVLVYMFFETPDWTTELRERHRMLLDMLRLADRLGVEYAFPTRTLHMISEPGETDRATPPPPDRDADEKAARQGRRAVHELTRQAGWRDGKPEPYVFRGAAPPDDDGETQIESRVGGDG